MLLQRRDTRANLTIDETARPIYALGIKIAVVLAVCLSAVPRLAFAGQLVDSVIEQPPHLSGIVTAGSMRQAIFEDDGRPRAGGVGDRFGAYRITRIEPFEVVVDGPHGVMMLSPDGTATRAALVAEAPRSGSAEPSLIDKLNTQPPPTLRVPPPPSLTHMLSRLPKNGH